MERRVWLFAVALTVSLIPGTPRAQWRPKVIYGGDDRLDLYQLQNEGVRKLADSTVALMRSGKVTVKDGTAQLLTESFSERDNLCPEEPFAGQKTAAFCSGSLVGPDLVMTAGHCVTSEEACKDVKFVFGFAVAKEGVAPDSVPAGEVYGCAKLIGREQVGNGADWAIVQLDRAVSGHAPLKINRSGAIEKGAPLLVIGHPAGLPLKVAGGASVRDAGPEGYFVANLDTYGGNSGSAVFNAKTGMIEGILVRGEQDFEWKGTCRVSKRCEDTACRGEDVTRISVLASRIPATEPAGAAASLAAAFSRPDGAFSALVGLAAAASGSVAAGR